MIELQRTEEAEALELPLEEGGVTAGFPVPVDTGEWSSIDLNRELIRRPETTFCGRVRGESMVEAGIHSGDLIIIDRLLDWRSGDIVVAYVSGEFTLKRIVRRGGQVVLQPANPDYPEIVVGPGEELRIWGVVLYSIHDLRKK